MRELGPRRLALDSACLAAVLWLSTAYYLLLITGLQATGDLVGLLRDEIEEGASTS